MQTFNRYWYIYFFPPFVLPYMFRLLESHVWGIINRMLQNTVEHKIAY